MGKDQELLLEAARSGKVATVQKILSHRRSGRLTSIRRGPGSNVQDSNGFTPLHHASVNGHDEIVALLLGADASPSIVDSKGASPLHLAAWAGHENIVAMLLGHKNQPVNVDLATKSNDTALHYAAEYGHTSVVMQLLRSGANPLALNAVGDTPLDLAAHFGKFDTVEKLIKHCPKLVEKYRTENSRGRLFENTPLHRASMNGHSPVVLILLKAGVDVNCMTTRWGTALHVGAMFGKYDVVKTLLKHGADHRLTDAEGRTVRGALMTLPANATRGILDLINKHALNNGFDSEELPSPDIPESWTPSSPRRIPDRRSHYAGPLNEPKSSSGEKHSKLQPQQFVKKIASALGFKFNSDPNVSQINKDDNVPKRKSDIFKRSNSSNPFHIGNSTFFEFNKKKTAPSGEFDTTSLPCNDEFKFSVESRTDATNTSNRSYPPFKTSLTNIIENGESESDDSDASNETSSSFEMMKEDREVDAETRHKINNLHTIEELPVLAENEIEDSVHDNIEQEATVLNQFKRINPESNDNIEEVKPTKDDDSSEEVSKAVSVEITSYTSIEKKNVLKTTYYENVTVDKGLVKPVPAVRTNVPPKAKIENDDDKIYINIVLKDHIKPEPAKRFFINKNSDVHNIYENVIPKGDENDEGEKTLTRMSSKASIDSVDSFINGSCFEDIMMSKKSTSFRRNRPTNWSFLKEKQNNIVRTRSMKSEATSYTTEVLTIDEEDCTSVTDDINESLYKTLPARSSKNFDESVKPGVNFRTMPRTDTNAISENYHIRGTGNCIYQAPTINEFLYIFNRDTLEYEGSTQNTKSNHKHFSASAICFCRPQKVKPAKSEGDLLDLADSEFRVDVSQFLNAAKQKINSFRCYCESKSSCTLQHHKPKSFTVTFQKLRRSNSFPLVNSPLADATDNPFLVAEVESSSVSDVSSISFGVLSEQSTLKSVNSTAGISNNGIVHSSSFVGDGDELSLSSAASAHHHDYNKISPTPPKKPPRRNLSVSPTHAALPPPPGYNYDYLNRSVHARSQDDLDDIQYSKHHLKLGSSVDHYLEYKHKFSDYDTSTAPRLVPVPNPRPSLRNQQPVAITTMYGDVAVREQNSKRKLRRTLQENYAGDSVKRNSTQDKSSFESLLDDNENRYYEEYVPSSPTHYEQPPTPEHPPPSARQAEIYIHEKIRPLSQEYKRRSAGLRDSWTETELCILRTSSAASIASGATDRSANTDNCVEEYVCSVPFAGLFKGSTTTLDNVGVRPMPAERPKTLRKLKNVYDTSPTEHHTQPSSQPLQGNNGLQTADNEEVIRRRSNTTSSNLSAGDKSLSILSPFDEQEEWAKISEIMESFGSKLARESVFMSEIEQEFQNKLGLSCSESSLSPSVGSSVGHWLYGLGLADYESTFISNGYDDLDFINGVISESDLKEMNVDNISDRNKILEAIKELPHKINDILVLRNKYRNNAIDKQSVEDWLNQINLEHYSETFQKHFYVDMDKISKIWEVELMAVLEIHKLGHRRRILASISGQENGPVIFENDLHNLKNNIQQLKSENPAINENQMKPLASQHMNIPPSSGGGETLKRSKKNRPAPQPPKPSDLEIRAPSELLVGVPGALKTQWRHQPFVLVTGAVTYVANYLGSTVVKELKGTESTKKSIQKLKKTTKEPRDSPDIILSISYRGVKFLNTITKELVCEHEIRNIHCACQDADDLTHFAYITKDHTTKCHYCHVFRVATMDQATEVILTLGEAFEVAYQMALRDAQLTRNIPKQAATLHAQSKTPTHESQTIKDKSLHGRSHSITEIKLNGHQLKIAPIPASLSNDDFQFGKDVNARGPIAYIKAPIASTEEL